MEKSRIFVPYLVIFLVIATFSACGSRARNERSGEVIQQQTTTTTERPVVKETTTTTTSKTQ